MFKFNLIAFALIISLSNSSTSQGATGTLRCSGDKTSMIRAVRSLNRMLKEDAAVDQVSAPVLYYSDTETHFLACVQIKTESSLTEQRRAQLPVVVCGEDQGSMLNALRKLNSELEPYASDDISAPTFFSNNTNLACTSLRSSKELPITDKPSSIVERIRPRIFQQSRISCKDAFPPNIHEFKQ